MIRAAPVPTQPLAKPLTRPSFHVQPTVTGRPLTSNRYTVSAWQTAPASQPNA
jgi:hypothetical protein